MSQSYNHGKDWRGTAPPNGLRVAACELEGTRWVLYVRPDKCTHRWLSLKLCAIPGAKRKANYWLGWSRTGYGLSKTRGRFALEAHRPALVQWVRETLGDKTIAEADRLYEPVDVEAMIEEQMKLDDLLGVGNETVQS